MSMNSYEAASAQPCTPCLLVSVGNTATFNIQVGKRLNKDGSNSENFVETYTVAKVDNEQFLIVYQAAEQDENHKVELSDVKILVNETDEFLTSPGNQKGKAFDVEPGKRSPSPSSA